MADDKLEKLLQEVHRSESVPRFEEVWRRAEAMRERPAKDRFVWQGILVPAAALATIAIVVFAVLPMEESSGPAKVINASPMLADLGDAGLWNAPLDGLGTEWSFEIALLDEIEDAESEEQGLAISRNIPGEDMYESPTDFLLNLEIPAWSKAEGRSVL